MDTLEKDAYELLKKLQIDYLRVDHPAITSVKDISFELPGPQVKNLVLKSRKGKKIYLVIVPDEKQVDLKCLAELLGEKRLSFVSSVKLQEILRVPPGTVTPLALPYDKEHQITVVIDDSIDRTDTVGFHPNVNTTTLMISFQNFEKILAYLGYQPLFVRLESC